MTAHDPVDMYVRATDGTNLHATAWLPIQRETERVVLVLHGIGYHGAAYGVIASPLAGAGLPAYALDLRGHGRSEGTRGTLASVPTLLSDIAAVAEHILRRHPDSRLAMVGESMGGLLAAAFAADKPELVERLVLLAPAVRLRCRHIFKRDAPSVLRATATDFRRPVVSLVDWRLDISSRDDDFKRRRRTDTLALPAVSPQYLLTLASVAHRLLRTGVCRITSPALVIQGGRDYLLHPAGAEQLAKRLESSSELLLLTHAHHTLLWDPETPRVLESLLHWMMDSLRQHE